MNQEKKMNQVSIVEVATEYDVRLTYHSDIKAEDYDAIITVREEADNRITIEPNNCNSKFEFRHSDPDRVIALCQMMMAAAQMVKDNNQKSIEALTQAPTCASI